MICTEVKVAVANLETGLFTHSHARELEVDSLVPCLEMHSCAQGIVNYLGTT